MIHASDAIRDTIELIRKVAPTSASVLLRGESGTGKELAARTLHELSDRAHGPFVAIDCGAIPETLIESELFGREKGAFTGASHRQAGLFERARGGTLFLDELVSMPVSSQAKLLRAIEERAFRRLGGTDEVSLDARIVAAVNEDPERAIEQGRLREDLYYRINVITIALPPLRERDEDIVVLTQSFIQEFNRDNGKAIVGLDDAALRALGDYSWPGNVRELRNVVERAVILAESNRISLRDLPAKVTAGPTPDEEPPLERPPHGPPWVGSTIDETIRRLLLDTLEASGFNKTLTAKTLGVSTKTVYNKLKEWSGQGDTEARLAEWRCRARGTGAPGQAGRLVRMSASRSATLATAESA